MTIRSPGSKAPRPAASGRAEPDHQLPPAGGGTAGSARSSLGDLLRSLADDTQTLVRQEISLAKVEAARTAKRVAADSAWIAAGAGAIAVGGLCLVLALALGLGALLGSYWLGTLITGALLVVLGAAFAWKGVRDLRTTELAPRRTMETLREDADWARSEVRDFKDELTKERR